MNKSDLRSWLGSVVMGFGWGILLLVVIAQTHFWVQLASSNTQPQPQPTALYYVQPNDTLWTIARSNYESRYVPEIVSKIRKVNGWKPGHVLSPGELIKLP